MTTNATPITTPATQVPDVAEALATALTRAYPPAIMTLEDVAAVLGYSYNFVRNSLQYQPGFPARLPKFLQPRWDRKAVLEWAEVQHASV